MNTENIQMKGSYHIKVVDKHGVEKLDREVHNAVVTAGKGLITSRLGQSSATVAAYIALGTSNTAVSPGQTALTSEIVDSGLQRVLGTFSQQTSSVSNDTFQLVNTFTVSGSKTVEELGIFNASSSGTMLSRALTGSISLVSGDQIQITYKLTFN